MSIDKSTSLAGVVLSGEKKVSSTEIWYDSRTAYPREPCCW